MRFTSTWPILANALAISTVALLSLIPAANALGVEIRFTHPANLPGGKTENLLIGTPDTLRWKITQQDRSLSGVSTGELFLLNANGYNYSLQQNVALEDLKFHLTIPAVHFGPQYYIRFHTPVGEFNSDSFNLYSPVSFRST